MWADIIFIAVIFGCIFSGYKKGFMVTVIKTASLIVSIIMTVYMFKPFKNLIYSIPVIAQMLEAIKQTIARFAVAPMLGSEAELPQIFAAIVSADAINTGRDYVAMAIADIILSAALMIIFLLLVKVIIALVIKFAKIASKLPVIKQANALLGTLSGFFSGVLICYITSAVIFVFQSCNAGWVNLFMTDSILAQYFIDTNMIIKSLF